MLETENLGTHPLDKTVDLILHQALEGEDISTDDAVFLLQQKEMTTIATIKATADELRRRQVGSRVTYVINRNINFTNICEQHCSFCAFRRDEGDRDSFWLDTAQILEKTRDAVNQGATEICMQGGLNPQAKYQGKSLPYYLRLIATIKDEFPHLHFHAFSPQEVQFIAREDSLTFRDVIIALRDGGVNSMPGTAAEVLDDTVRRVICPEKINSEIWLEIVETALQLGVPMTSTMLCGHIETAKQQIQHLEKLRSLQEKAITNNYPARITEFILLPFVGQDAPAPLRHRVGRDQPSLEDTLLLTAVSRIYLGNWIKNHQPSWVKLGLEGAKKALNCGCNDIGGTLMEEHISTMAGAQGGTYQTVADLQNAIASLARPYQQRDTLYRLI